MAKFQYQGTTAQGVPQSGEIEAADEQAAQNALRARHITPYELVLIKESKRIEDIISRQRKVPEDALVVFTRQLATMIDANVTVFNSLTMLAEQQDNIRLREALQLVARGVEEGTTLADSFGLEPDIFSELYIAMVRAGEESGNLDETLRQLAVQLERNARIRKQVKAAMRYPLVVMAIAGIVLMVLMIWVVPTFITLFADLGSQLPLLTRVVVSLSEIIKPPDGLIFPLPPLLFYGIFVGSFVLAAVLFQYVRLPGIISTVIAATTGVFLTLVLFTIQFEPNWMVVKVLPALPGGTQLSVAALQLQLPHGFIPVPGFLAVLFRLMILSGVFIGTRAVWRWWTNTEEGRWWWHRFQLNAPMKIGSVVQKVAVARFTRTLSTLTRSQVPILTAFDIVRGTSGNMLIEAATENARERLIAGSTIAEPLAEANVFPPMVTRMIHVGEETGALDDMLLKAAEYYEEEVDIALKNLSSILEPIMIVFVGIIVGTIVVALYLPMFQIYNLIGELQ